MCKLSATQSSIKSCEELKNIILGKYTIETVADDTSETGNTSETGDTDETGNTGNTGETGKIGDTSNTTKCVRK
ncbi:16129_t:CDS:2 [Gigaspora margarita]|uniref:16129_t:CDS:1 n=1 Tax=Gigaspora margarita TaxID=4874 RepID=A0ABN7UMM9_GIGMA|nr:16129_t:CDS:2 [Gigaspora margarita]